MNDSINFRSFKEGDYEICCEWWKWWWKRTGLNPIQRALLPSDERCFIIEKNGIPVAAYFLLVFEFRLVAFTTYLVTPLERWPSWRSSPPAQSTRSSSSSKTAAGLWISTLVQLPRKCRTSGATRRLPR